MEFEVRIFSNFEAYSGGHPKYVERVKCTQAFDFHKCLDVFSSIYGPSVVFVFIAF